MYTASPTPDHHQDSPQVFLVSISVTSNKFSANTGPQTWTSSPTPSSDFKPSGSSAPYSFFSSHHNSLTKGYCYPLPSIIPWYTDL